MSPHNILYFAIILSLFMSSALSQIQSTKTCDHDWFGSKCQFKCHCHRDRICDINGTCPDNICASGWFGPACQFSDFADAYFKWLSDNDNNTCNPDQTMNSIIINLDIYIPFTWLRLQVKDPSLLKQFELMFTSTNKTSYNCEKMRTAWVNDRTLDIHCELDLRIRAVILTGQGVGSLCSLYISGGRNVALRQNTSQSSTYSDDTLKQSGKNADAKNAVGDNRDQEFYNGGCTHTAFSDQNPTWNVSLSPEQIINRVVLYNRDKLIERLQGFTLKCFTKDEQIVFNYTDKKNPQLFHDIIFNKMIKTPVSKVSIQAHHQHNNMVILTLCEVELYGDSSCPPSMYGRECEHTCNCAVENDSCFVSTGGCPSGCAAGFQGESCDMPCEAGKYGEGCGYNCSQFCVASNSSSTSCHHVTGTCLFGCLAGYQGANCGQKITEDYNFIVIVIPVLVITIIMIPVIVVIVICFRRYKHRTLYSRSSVRSNNSIHVYETVDDKSQKPEYIKSSSL